MVCSLFLFFLFGALFGEIMDEIWKERQHPDVLVGFTLAAATLSLCIGFLETRNQHVTAGWPREG